MKKKLSLVLGLFIFMSISLVACGNGEQQKEVKTIKVVVPDGLPAISMAKAIKENKELDKDYKIEYSIEKTPENIVTAVMKGEADIAIVPSNVGATQYNKKAGYKIAATVGWGSFYVVSTEEGQLKDLVKKEEVYNIGRGLTPDIVTQTILKQKGINVESEVKLSYVNGANELPPVILTGKAKVAVVPEPALSTILTKKQDLKVISNLNDEWKKEFDSKYGFPQSTIIVKDSLINEDKDFINKFLAEVNDSVNWANTSNENLPYYCEDIGVTANKDIILKSIKNANLNFVKIADTKEEYKNYFNKLKEFDVKTIGGQVPDEGVFME
ncbi:MAG: ABC transporter substrate-binding protein [Clostridium sp.]